MLGSMKRSTLPVTALWLTMAFLSAPNGVAQEKSIGSGPGGPAFVSPPGQRPDGPGGSAYQHGGWKQTIFGKADSTGWLFEPQDPAPAHAPLVIFLHGWAAIDPFLYGAWVEHLVRRGNVVLYPRFQSTLFSDPDGFQENVRASVRAGMAQLTQAGHVKVNEGQTACLGHSMGGILAANLTGGAVAAGLPQPKVLMCVQPGGSRAPAGGLGIVLNDPAAIPEGTLLLSVAGDQDQVVGDVDAVKIYRGARHVPAADRNLVYFQTDNHGSLPLRANHYAPCSLPGAFCESPGEPPAGAFPHKLRAMFGVAMGDFIPLRYLLQTDDGREWMHSRLSCPVYAETFYTPDATDFDHWRLFDALCDAAFSGTNRGLALGNTPGQKYRGSWSDGTPVRELRVIADPAESWAN